MTRKGHLLLGAAALAGAAWLWLGMSGRRLSLVHVDHVVAVAQTNGLTGLVVFSAAQIGVAALGVLPASLLAIGAGLAYGFWFGALISTISTMLGGWLAFSMARSVLRPWIERLVHRGVARRFDDAIAGNGWKFVCLLRVSPLMPFAATSYGLGLTRIGHRSFLLGTLASLPALLGYVAIGAFTKAGLALGRDGLGLLHGVLLTIGAVATLLTAIRIQHMLRSCLAKTSDASFAITGRTAEGSR